MKVVQLEVKVLVAEVKTTTKRRNVGRCGDEGMTRIKTIGSRVRNAQKVGGVVLKRVRVYSPKYQVGFAVWGKHTWCGLP